MVYCRSAAEANGTPQRAPERSGFELGGRDAHNPGEDMPELAHSERSKSYRALGSGKIGLRGLPRES